LATDASVGMRLRVGVIGLGDAWETRHRTALRSMSDRFEVRAVCDQVPHRAEQAAIEFKAQAVDGFRELVVREDIDAVLIFGSPWYGSLPILAACESGKAVYCAAGLDLDVEEARQIKLRVEQAGIAFMAEFARRHAPATLRLKELIATDLGPPC
jgi:predicted dehydrogenase